MKCSKTASNWQRVYEQTIWIVGSRSGRRRIDRKSTRLNSSHLVISYAVFCLKKKIVQIVPEAVGTWTRPSAVRQPYVPFQHLVQIRIALGPERREGLSELLAGPRTMAEGVTR